MKKGMKYFALSIVLLSSLLVGDSTATTYIAEPVLVTQPVYSGMSFYVYRPYNLPAGWFLTYDGYPVQMNQGGAWVYGTPSNGVLTPTTYVVGSVNPTNVPQLTPVTGNMPSNANNYNMASTPQYAPTAQNMSPAWLLNPNFTAVSDWGLSVDRMAVLNKPRVPLAWKGDKPKAIYAWTGKSWFQMLARNGESPADILKRNAYTLTCMTNQNNFIWNDSDTAILASQTPIWGYLWMGLATPISF